MINAICKTYIETDCGDFKCGDLVIIQTTYLSNITGVINELYENHLELDRSEKYQSSIANINYEHIKNIKKIEV